MRHSLLCLLFAIAAVVACTVAVLCLCHPCPCNGAPAPRPKVVKPLERDDLIGEWNLQWGAGKGTCLLAKGGFFAEKWYGWTWQGKWEYKDGALTVLEWMLNDDGTSTESGTLLWQATLKPGTRAGTLKILRGNEASGDGWQRSALFCLTPIKKKKPDA